MKKVVDKDKCCGCSACFNACPVNAITMREGYDGFLYPDIEENCIDCQRCLNVCPVINTRPEEKSKQYGYVVQNKDETVLRESTSGGAFTAVAEYVIEHGGIVYGAAFDSSFTVRHISAKSKSELHRFRNSKYVQSETGVCFKEIKNQLEDGKLVCFSGTPCQVEGLSYYLGKKYENLILVDVVCHAVPSPLVWKKYIEYRKSKLSKNFSDLKFRDKFFGYKYSTMSFFDEGINVYHNGIETDEYLRAFFSNICDRLSCYNCQFKKRYRVSDYTLWDCFEVERYFSDIDNDKGATKMLIHSEKGKQLFDIFFDKLVYKEITPDRLVENSEMMFKSVEYNSRREEFFTNAKALNPTEFFKKYFPITFSVKFERFVRIIGLKFGIYKLIRNTYKKFFGDKKR